MKKLIILFSIFISSVSFSMDKYIMAVNSKITKQEAQYISNTVMEMSKIYNINPKLVFAVMQTESTFNHNVTSSAGAKGLMQLMPFNFKEFNTDNTILGNIKGGIMHLKRDLTKYNNDVKKALICYNAGCGRLKNDRWKKIKETRDYIVKVKNNYNKIEQYLNKGENQIKSSINLSTDIKSEFETKQRKKGDVKNWNKINIISNINRAKE